MRSRSVKSLAVNALQVSRGRTVLFQNLSFTLNAGEALLVRGANGCGKTSLLRAIAGFLSADAGDVRLNGSALAPLSVLARAHLHYSGHASGFKAEFDAIENLHCALALEGQEVSTEALLQALAAVGLLERRRIQVRALSQGQRRRIALAQLGLTERSVWLLDEPTNALDADGVAIAQQTVSAHLRAGGIAVIATHLPFSVEGVLASGVRELNIAAYAASTNGAIASS